MQEPQFYLIAMDLLCPSPLEVELSADHSFYLEMMRATRAETTLNSPPVFTVMKGTQATDMLRVWEPGIYLFSDRIIQAMRAAKLSGWSSCPVIIQGRPDLSYNLLQTSGRCGKVDASRIKHVVLDAGRPFTAEQIDGVGLFFDLSTWDRSDLFLPEPGPRVIVTEDAHKAFDLIVPKISHFVLTPNQDAPMGPIFK